MEFKIDEDFVSLLKYLELTDLLGLGKILKVEEEDDFKDYITKIYLAWAEHPHKEKIRQLIEDVVYFNQNSETKKLEVKKFNISKVKSSKDKTKDKNKGKTKVKKKRK